MYSSVLIPAWSLTGRYGPGLNIHIVRHYSFAAMMVGIFRRLGDGRSCLGVGCGKTDAQALPGLLVAWALTLVGLQVADLWAEWPRRHLCGRSIVAA